VRSDKEFNYITSFYFETGMVQLLKLQIAQKKVDTKMTTGRKLEASAVSVVISAGHVGNTNHFQAVALINQK
jgi:hypothetical protein